MGQHDTINNSCTGRRARQPWRTRWSLRWRKYVELTYILRNSIDLVTNSDLNLLFLPLLPLVAQSREEKLLPCIMVRSWWVMVGGGLAGFGYVSGKSDRVGQGCQMVTTENRHQSALDPPKNRPYSNRPKPRNNRKGRPKFDFLAAK